MAKKLKTFKVSYEVSKETTIQAESQEKAIELVEKEIKKSGDRTTTNLVVDEVTE